ncbi:hypothetical protein [uncultured Helicobacter sp.]|uniref:hypothetical protein n=1 Tax=uncultured Helicobacter sp. TaxID=175537 RepID=UPI00374F8993
MLQKILFFSLSITLLQGADKILIDSTLSAQKASVYEQVIYSVSIQIHQEVFEKIHSLDIARLYLPKAKVIEIERIEGINRGEYIVYEMRYCLYPLESGTLKIEPLSVQVGFEEEDSLTQDEEAHDVFLSPKSTRTPSHTLLRTLSTPAHKLEVTPLRLDSQDNLYTKTPLYGTSRLITQSPARDVSAGEPLEFNIALESYGDIFDLDFVLDIPNVSIYATPATISSKWSEGRYLHTLSKHFTLIAQDTYEIPSFGYSYVQHTKVYPIASTPYAIHIQDAPLPMHQIRDSLSLWWLGLVIVAVLCMGLWLWWRQSHKRLYRLIARSHSYNELLGVILARTPHAYTSFVRALESRLYDSNSPSKLPKNSYDKKLLRTLAKEFYNTQSKELV